MRRADNVPIVLKYGSLNFLEHSGPVQARTGIDLPFFTSNTECHENPSSESRTVPCGQTDRHDESNGHVSYFCERAKKQFRKFLSVISLIFKAFCFILRSQSLHTNNKQKCGYQKKSSNTISICCDFDRASSLICGNKMPTRCNRGFYCRSYCLLNMFRAPLCPSSGAQEYYTVVAACGISCCGFQVAGLV